MGSAAKYAELLRRFRTRTSYWHSQSNWCDQVEISAGKTE
jgi:hypothetical protein